MESSILFKCGVSSKVSTSGMLTSNCKRYGAGKALFVTLLHTYGVPYEMRNFAVSGELRGKTVAKFICHGTPGGVFRD